MKSCALVTGASGGIGTAICKKLSSEGVAVLGVDVKEPSPGKRAADFLLADLDRFAESEEDAKSVVRGVVRWLAGRPLGLLVNNAAVQHLGAMDDLDRPAWRRTLNVNVLAPFFLVQALLPQLKSARGCVVNISSVHARATKPRFVAYATSKSALSGLTRALAVDLGRDVPVYGIEPGAVLTEMLREGLAGSPDALDKLAECHPSGRISAPEQIAELVHFLFSSGMTGLQGSAIEFGGGISGRLHDPE